MKPTRQETVRRYGLLGLRLLITAFGIAFPSRPGWGPPPFPACPMWSACSPPERGDATICLHGVLILLQLLILRRRYDPVQLLQGLPVALVFGTSPTWGSG